MTKIRRGQLWMCIDERHSPTYVRLLLVLHRVTDERHEALADYHNTRTGRPFPPKAVWWNCVLYTTLERMRYSYSERDIDEGFKLLSDLV